MFSTATPIENALGMIRERRFADLRTRLAARMHREWKSFGLRRDLTIPMDPPPARIPIAVRPIQDRDVPLLFAHDPALPPEERREIELRRAHLDAGIPRCYVAIDLRNDEPCYMQWLMGPEQNARIEEFFQGRFPVLAKDEALLENAYTPVKYRGKGIMPAAMAMIAEQARDLGARYVVTFVAQDNVPSLKGCKKAGFDPYLLRHDRQYCFRLFRTRRFEPLADGFVLPYERDRAKAA